MVKVIGTIIKNSYGGTLEKSEEIVRIIRRLPRTGSLFRNGTENG